MAKILVIEDEAVLRKEVMRWLKLEDYDVIGACDGIEGVELALREKPQLILCDIGLPRQEGYEVMLELRANVETQLTPFIYMTARASHEDIRKGMSLGADDYITKPFTRLELLEAIRAALSKKVLQEQRHQDDLEQWQEALKQEQEQRMFKAKLMAMFSHEFRNPLASIQSSNMILQNYIDRMDESQRESHFVRIDRSVNRLLQMLDDMLVIAQLETGNLTFKPQSIQISGFIQEIIEEFQALHGSAYPLIFKTNFSSALTADPRLLRQIVTNLISNAIKYSNQASEVLVTLEQHTRQTITLSVQDHGIGIPEADQARLFMPFQRASNVGRVQGTGLGLAIVQQAVELHGGSIHIESKVGEGTTVTITLDIAR